MNKLIIIIFVLLLTISVSPQTPTPTPKSILDEFAYSEKVEQKYDKFKDSTNLKLLLQIKGQPIPFKGLTASFSTTFDGEKPPAGMPLALIIIAVNDDALYKNSHSLIFLLDNQRFIPISGNYSAKANTVNSEQFIIEQASHLLTQAMVRT